MGFNLEIDLRTNGTADPIGLHGADTFRPTLKLIKIIKQGIGVIGDP